MSYWCTVRTSTTPITSVTSSTRASEKKWFKYSSTSTFSKAIILQASFQKKRYGKSNTYALKRNGKVRVTTLAALVEALDGNFEKNLPKAMIIAVLFLSNSPAVSIGTSVRHDSYAMYRSPPQVLPKSRIESCAAATGTRWVIQTGAEWRHRVDPLHQTTDLQQRIHINSRL